MRLDRCVAVRLKYIHWAVLFLREHLNSREITKEQGGNVPSVPQGA
jgi:hypothetical protein